MTIPAPERAPKCLRLVVNKRGKNPCESDRLPGSDYCAHHLADAVRQWNEIIAAHTLGTKAPDGDAH